MYANRKRLYNMVEAQRKKREDAKAEKEQQKEIDRQAREAVEKAIGGLLKGRK